MNLHPRLTLTKFALAIVFLSFSTFAFGANWLMPVRSPMSNPMTKNIKTFADQVAKQTDGSLTITLYPADSLIKQPQVMESVSSGVVQVGGFLMSLMSNQNAMFAVDSIPFLATTYKANQTLSEAARPAIEKILNKMGLKLLFIQNWPFQGIYASTEVTSPSSFSSFKMRAYNHNTAEIAKRLGSTPVVIQQADVPQAFLTGVVDAMITSPTTGVQTQSWDFLNYFYNVKAFSTWNLVVVNKNSFNSLSKKDQHILIAASQKAQKRIWSKTPKLAQKQIGILKSHGVKIENPSPALRKKLKQIGDIMLKEWLKKTGQTGKAVIERYKDMTKTGS